MEADQTVEAWEVGSFAMSKDLPCVILAGGRGTRLLEETATIPKPMLDVGGKPLLQHVMDTYLKQDVTEFFIPVGYKSEMVYGYFMGQKPDRIGYDFDRTTFYFGTHTVTVVDTGVDTQTGGRLLRLRDYLEAYSHFYFTYGDGVANVNLSHLRLEHIGETLVTLTAVHPAGRFGRLDLRSSGQVKGFGEKVESQEDWVNGGFAIISTRVLIGIRGDQTNLEKDVYPAVARHGLMRAHRHEGFWKCVDTLRDLEELRNIYKQENVAPWLMLSSRGQQGS